MIYYKNEYKDVEPKQFPFEQGDLLFVICQEKGSVCLSLGKMYKLLLTYHGKKTLTLYATKAAQ